MNSDNITSKDRILNSTRELLFKHGMKKISVEEISQKAGVSKMTFYRNFRNKVHVVTYILDQLQAQSLVTFESIIHDKKPIHEKIEDILEIKLKNTEQFSEEFMAELWSSNDLVKHLMIGWKEKISKIYIRFIRDAQKKGEIRPEIKPEFILLLHDRLVEFIRDNAIRSLYKSHKDFIRDTFDFFHYGLLTTRKPNRSNIK